MSHLSITLWYKIIQRIPLLSNSYNDLDIDINRDAATIMSQYIRSEKENSLAVKYPELAAEWHPTRNGYISPEMVSYASGKKVWWLCSKGHSYQATVSNRYYGKNCPYCSNTKVLKGYNDLTSQYPQIAAEWNYSRNRETPDQVMPGSNKRIWWKCSTCGHEWIAQPNHRVFHRSGCPACSGRVATHDENLLVANPEVCKEWNVTRNKKSPSEYRPQSSQKVWWACSTCGYEWNARISERSKGTGCPCCAGKKVLRPPVKQQKKPVFCNQK